LGVTRGGYDYGPPIPFPPKTETGKKGNKTSSSKLNDSGDGPNTVAFSFGRFGQKRESRHSKTEIGDALNRQVVFTFGNFRTVALLMRIIMNETLPEAKQVTGDIFEIEGSIRDYYPKQLTFQGKDLKWSDRQLVDVGRYLLPVMVFRPPSELRELKKSKIQKEWHQNFIELNSRREVEALILNLREQAAVGNRLMHKTVYRGTGYMVQAGFSLINRTKYGNPKEVEKVAGMILNKGGTVVREVIDVAKQVRQRWAELFNPVTATKSEEYINTREAFKREEAKLLKQLNLMAEKRKVLVRRLDRIKRQKDKALSQLDPNHKVQTVQNGIFGDEFIEDVYIPGVDNTGASASTVTSSLAGLVDLNLDDDDDDDVYRGVSMDSVFR